MSHPSATAARYAHAVRVIDRATRAWMLALLVTGGCIEHRVAVTGGSLHRGLWALRTQGQTEVVVVHQRGHRRPVAALEVIAADQVVTVAGERTTPLVLGQGCRDLPSPAQAAVDPRCRLSALRDVGVELRTTTEVDGRRIGGYVAGGLALGLAAGVIGCELGCAADSTAKRASDVVVGGLAVALVGGIVWAIIDCSGRWGQPGCRD